MSATQHPRPVRHGQFGGALGTLVQGHPPTRPKGSRLTRTAALQASSLAAVSYVSDAQDVIAWCTGPGTLWVWTENKGEEQ